MSTGFIYGTGFAFNILSPNKFDKRDEFNFYDVVWWFTWYNIISLYTSTIKLQNNYDYLHVFYSYK